MTLFKGPRRLRIKTDVWSCRSRTRVCAFSPQARDAPERPLQLQGDISQQVGGRGERGTRTPHPRHGSWSPVLGGVFWKRPVVGGGRCPGAGDITASPGLRPALPPSVERNLRVGFGDTWPCWPEVLGGRAVCHVPLKAPGRRLLARRAPAGPRLLCGRPSTVRGAWTHGCPS